eukprot:m.146503 g.146503  ORF g.146503 m.146503 type:complete len:932 (+) comp16243_c0_seq1:166-2961(+)
MLNLTSLGLTVRLVAFVVWPLCICLPIALTTDPPPEGNVAIIFFALLPLWVWPLVYLGERLKLYSIDEAITVPEIFFGAAVAGFVLPVLVLVPLLETLSLTGQEHAILLFNIIILPGIWLPLVMAIVQTPIVLDSRLEQKKATSNSADTLSDTSYLKNEFRSTFLAWFVLTTIPFGMFLPIFIHSDSDGEGEAVIMFFLLLAGTASALFAVAPRLAWTLQHYYRLYDRPESYHVLMDVVLGMFFLPVMLMLPVLEEAKMAQQPHDMLQAFTIGVPSVALLKAVYERYAPYPNESLATIMVGVVFLVVVLPMGILLPIWVSDPEAINAEGQIAFLVFMLSPIVTVLGYWVYLLFTENANLPFHLVTRYWQPIWWLEITYATAVFALPACIALPVYFHSNLASDADWVLVGYWVTIQVLLGVLFLASYAIRQPGVDDPWKHTPVLRPRSETVASHGNGMYRGPGHAEFDAGDLQSRRGTRVGPYTPKGGDGVDTDGLPLAANTLNGESLHHRPSVASTNSLAMPGQRVPTGLSVQRWGTNPTNANGDFTALDGSMESKPLPGQTSAVHTYDLAQSSSNRDRDDEDNRSAITAIEIPPPPAGAPPRSDIDSIGEYHGFGPDEPVSVPPTHVEHPHHEEHVHDGATDGYEQVELPERSDGDGSPWEACTLYTYDATRDMLVKDHSTTTAISISTEQNDEPRAGAYTTVYTAYITGTRDSFVLKWPFYASMQTAEAATIAMRKLQHGRRTVEMFNRAVESAGPPELKFTNSRVVQLTSRPDSKGRIPWVVFEPELEDFEATGVMDYYCIFNDSNGGVVSQDDMEMEGGDPSDNSWKADFNQANDLAQALSCYSFRASQKSSLMINMQGVRSTFTNPDFHFMNPEEDPYFSPHNNGEDGARAFFGTHRHNSFCQLALKSLPNFSPEWLSDGEYLQVL